MRVRLAELCIFVIYMGWFDNQDGKGGGAGRVTKARSVLGLISFLHELQTDIYRCGARSPESGERALGGSVI